MEPFSSCINIVNLDGSLATTAQWRFSWRWCMPQYSFIHKRNDQKRTAIENCERWTILLMEDCLPCFWDWQQHALKTSIDPSGSKVRLMYYPHMKQQKSDGMHVCGSVIVIIYQESRTVSVKFISKMWVLHDEHACWPGFWYQDWSTFPLDSFQHQQVWDCRMYHWNAWS